LEALEPRIALASQLSAMLSEGRTLRDCLGEIFDGMDLEITDEKPVSYGCPCSQERMEKALVSLGREELLKLIEEDGEAELTCHFCLNQIRFDKSDCRRCTKAPANREQMNTDSNRNRRIKVLAFKRQGQFSCTHRQPLCGRGDYLQALAFYRRAVSDEPKNMDSQAQLAGTVFGYVLL
jgi:hypothetical protein